MGLVESDIYLLCNAYLTASSFLYEYLWYLNFMQFMSQALRKAIADTFYKDLAVKDTKFFISDGTSHPNLCTILVYSNGAMGCNFYIFSAKSQLVEIIKLHNFL